ncbi:MAG: hypothetical protein A2Z20_11285 [Bdellovibrionales bacterium RBG_16_40_8]|nr:MAG: hypothetical protein A2Z20_11285 [Bdellovibrionales bacterium RBG_16_40_8]
MKKLGSIILLSFFLMSLPACKEGASFNENLKEVAVKLKNVEAITSLDLVSTEHYAAMTDYFRTVTDLAVSLKSDAKARKYWATRVKKHKISDFCAKYVLTATAWHNLNDQCTIDGHYLCPDEVREYPAILNAVLSNSPQSLKDDFYADDRCSGWREL